MSSSEIGIEVDRSRCVLCGEPNDCALAKGDVVQNEPCWCVDQRFPAALRERASAKDAGASCICRRCLEAATGDGVER